MSWSHKTYLKCSFQNRKLQRNNKSLFLFSPNFPENYCMAVKIKIKRRKCKMFLLWLLSFLNFRILLDENRYQTMEQKEKSLLWIDYMNSKQNSFHLLNQYTRMKYQLTYILIFPVSRICFTIWWIGIHLSYSFLH